MKNKSYAMLTASMLIFGTIGIFRRYIPLSSGLLACVRGILGSLFLVLYVLVKKKGCFRSTLRNQKTSSKTVLLLAITGGMIGINWIMLFEAYNYTSVATATLCYYMQPAIVMLLSPFVFKESFTLKKIICVIVSLAGMVLVSGVSGRESLSSSDVKGIFFGLAAAVLYATVVMLNKKILYEDAFGRTVIQLASAALILIPYLAVTEDFSRISLNAFSLVMILIVGIVHTGIAYAMYFSSMKNLSSQSIAVLSYIDPVSALLFSALILHESLSLSCIIGAVMIIGSALLSEKE